ncbi:MAG: phosphate/phosphite/phosphonate ABC transporter substrate-binding protein [Pedobacter sp.]
MARKLFILVVIGMIIPAMNLNAAEYYYFSVLNQRSPELIAKHWNPILDYVSAKSGVLLRLKIGKTAPETTALTVRGEAQFAFTNHLFTPERAKLGWKVIARQDTEGIQGEIVVLASSPIKAVEELNRKVVGFPSKEAFVGYWIPMDRLLRKNITVKEVFAGNQEGAMGQLRFGKVDAIGANSAVMKGYAAKENIAYRVLWRSETYHDLCIMASPRVPAATMRAVRQAFITMSQTAEGKKVLAQAAANINQKQSVGFVKSDDTEYENYKRFYKKTPVRE